ncbi:MAG: hypothetical protein AAGN66_06990 [Acidobacteriota bacterium]
MRTSKTYTVVEPNRAWSEWSRWMFESSGRANPLVQLPSREYPKGTQVVLTRDGVDRTIAKLAGGERLAKRLWDLEFSTPKESLVLDGRGIEWKLGDRVHVQVPDALPPEGEPNDDQNHDQNPVEDAWNRVAEESSGVFGAPRAKSIDGPRTARFFGTVALAVALLVLPVYGVLTSEPDSPPAPEYRRVQVLDLGEAVAGGRLLGLEVVDAAGAPIDDPFGVQVSVACRSGCGLSGDPPDGMWLESYNGVVLGAAPWFGVFREAGPTRFYLRTEDDGLLRPDAEAFSNSRVRVTARLALHPSDPPYQLVDGTADFDFSGGG